MTQDEGTREGKKLEVDPAYLKQVTKRFNEVLAEAAREHTQPADLASLKVVIFSDLHRGTRDGADDFQRCERAYAAALAYYLEEGFDLFLLGDIEELWEESPEDVIPRYRAVMDLEDEFRLREETKLERFFGNHDDDWATPSAVTKHLGREMKVREALLLPIHDGGQHIGSLFFAHGHQGTTESDRFGRLARIPVRLFWRPLQRKVGYSATTPATEYGVRGKHDTAMYEWARRHHSDPPLVLVTGHTHRPVFSMPPQPENTVEELERLLEEARAQGAPTVPNLRADLEHRKAISRYSAGRTISVDSPCYFNTGCCSFPDGDITGLEISDGEIRLVRWPDDDDKPRRKQLGDPKALRDVFREVVEKRGQASDVREFQA